jgi:hypothetical protein
MGMSSYRNAVHLEVDERGIVICACLILRFGAKPIFIPRDEIEIEDGNFFFLKMVRFRCKSFPGYSILFRPKLAKKIRELMFTSPLN